MYHLVEWDSAFFKMKVARIDKCQPSIKALFEIIEELRSNNYALAYLASSRKYSIDAIRSMGGQCVDEKLTFLLELNENGTHVFDSIVVPFGKSMKIGDIEKLAMASGKYSRYAADPRFPVELFEALYKEWGRRSALREIVKEVLVIENNGNVVGFVTLGGHEKEGFIGLIAVDETYQGKGYGKLLINAAKKWFVNNGYKKVRVVTQAVNSVACSLYSKAQFRVEKRDYFYHFWMNG
jgi:ribosomal protein S18 acetylase RimI-like enzyme